MKTRSLVYPAPLEQQAESLDHCQPSSMIILNSGSFLLFRIRSIID
jgi:hypothetical protein